MAAYQRWDQRNVEVCCMKLHKQCLQLPRGHLEVVRKLVNSKTGVAKKKGMKKAIVAVARKLAVIMHRMLVDKTEFYYQ